jgi:hypothetical protein
MRILPVIALLLAWVPALAGTRQDDARVLMPSDPASLKLEQDWGFSDAIVTGDTIYLSGVVAEFARVRPILGSATRARSSGSATF